MAEMRELFEMTTKQVEPDQDSWRKQDERHHRADRRRKFGALAVAGAIGVAALVVVIQVRDEGNGTQSGDQPNGGSTIPTVEPVPALSATGDVDPGRHVFSSSDPAFDASHRITIDVVDGYGAFDDAAVLKDGGSVSTLAVSAVWADPCQWQGSLLDRSAMASTDAVVAALGSQAGLRVSTPTAVAVDGLDATFMERRVPAQIDTDTCDRGDNGGEFRVYRSPEFGTRILQSGQRQLLWIVDVDGVPLVIDAIHDPATSADVRAELLQMVESIQIEPLN
jgi:hypothetical protein